MFGELISIALATRLLSVSALPVAPPTDNDGAPPKTNLTRLNPTYTTDQMNKLMLAPTVVERFKLLQGFGSPDDYFKFDFTPNGFMSNAGNGQGGQGFLAAVQNYPVLHGTGISMAIGYLTPCGLDSMHVHPRATEFLILVNGKSLHTGFVQEDGFTDPILTTVGLYQGTIRPQGAIHYEFNDHCEPAVFVTGLSNEDPGVSRTAQNFFVEDPALVDADLGFPEFLNGTNLKHFAKTIPAAFALGAAKCLKRCGLTYNATQH